MDASSPATALKRFDASQGPRNIGPEDGHYVQLPGVGVRFMLWTEESGGDVSVVEHPIAPRTLCAPLHRHSREDEYSFVLEGRMGAQLGEDVVYAEAGDFVFKPRDQWHTFWNAGDDHLVAQQRADPALEHEAVLVLAGGGAAGRPERGAPSGARRGRSGPRSRRRRS